jgi:hypothetical protein
MGFEPRSIMVLSFERRAETAEVRVSNIRITATLSLIVRITVDLVLTD